MAKTREVHHALEQRLLHTLFFCFGFGIMAWVPRFPEVKKNLGLDNGAFGSLISTGSIGAFFGLLTVGHIVHRLGVKRVVLVAIAILFGSLALILHVKGSFLFLICNIAIGFGVTAVHVCINSQALNFLDRSERNLVTSAAGYWSAGALSTAIISGFMVGHVGLKTHLDILYLCDAILMSALVVRLQAVLLRANTNTKSDYSIKDIFTSFKIDWPVSIGMACACYLEFCIGDWGTIFTKERLSIESGLSTAPYILFTAMMIFGRLYIQKLIPRAPLHKWVKRASLLAGFGFLIPIAIAVNLPASMKWTSYGLFILAFIIGGIGSSFMGPTFFAAANRRSPLPSAVVIGQFGVTNNVLMFICKWVVAWTIQFTGSMTIAFMIPVAMILATGLFAHVLDEERAN